MLDTCLEPPNPQPIKYKFEVNSAVQYGEEYGVISEIHGMEYAEVEMVMWLSLCYACVFYQHKLLSYSHRFSIKCIFYIITQCDISGSFHTKSTKKNPHPLRFLWKLAHMLGP